MEPERGGLLRLIVLRWAAGALAVGLTAALLPGFDVDGGIATLFGIALVLGIVNAVVGTVVRILALPLIVLTLGVVLLAINALMLLLTDGLLDSLEIDGFWWALAGSLVISLVMAVVEVVVDEG